MNKRAVRSWMLYDWANSAYATTMIAAVLPIFYKDVAGDSLGGNTAEVYWGYSQSAAMLLVALLAPILGAIADMSGRKILFLRLFSYAGILASFLFAFVGSGDYVFASILLIVGSVGFSGGNTFYDALLPDLVQKDQRDAISSRGYAYGYLGGGVLLAINLLMIKKPDVFGFPNTVVAIQAAFATVAIWWFVFSLPLFRNVKETRPESQLNLSKYTMAGVSRLKATIVKLKYYPELLKYMIAFWFFNDGISTIITMATIYGKGIGIGTSHLITALLITQFVGIPFTLLFGKIAKWLGSKQSLYISLGVYVIIVILGYSMTSALHFYLLAMLVGVVQGGSQAIARSIYSNLIPKAQSAEFFGFLSVSSKFSSMMGPFIFALVGQLTGSSRLAILSLVMFFIVGIVMLTRVNLSKGEEEAASTSRLIPPSAG